MASYLSISITQNSQNITKNTSNVTVKVSIYSEASWNSDASSTSGSYCTINGTKRSFTHTFTKGTTQIYSWTGDIAHNADGSKTLSVYASFNTDVSLGTLTKSASKTLTAIPRASTPTLSASSFDAGSALTITTNRASSSFTHTLTYSLNGATGTIASEVGASYTWTNTKELAGLIPAKTSDTVTITCKTYNGSTLIGTKTVTATIKIPETADFMPLISSVTVEDTKGYASKYGGYVQGKSVPKLTISAASEYSDIKSYKVKFQGSTVTVSSNVISLATISETGTLNIVVTATDGRGRTASTTITIDALEYNAPTVLLKVVRCDSNGTENDEGAYMKVSCDASVVPLNDVNSKTVALQYKKKSSESWTTHKTWTAYAVSEDVIIAANTDSSYDIQLVAEDDFTGDTPATYNAEIGTVEVIMDFNKNGKGLAIGKVSENEGFEVDWDAVFNAPVTLKDNLTGKYLIGTWLQSTGTTDLGKTATKVAVLDANGWIYYRTPTELLKDLGIEDFVVEQGTSGIWKYRKWNSGFAECWGIATTGTLTMTAMGSVYYSDPITISIPEFLKKCTASVYNPRVNNVLSFSDYAVDATAHTIKVRVKKSSTDTSSSNFSALLYGTWK